MRVWHVVSACIVLAAHLGRAMLFSLLRSSFATGFATAMLLSLLRCLVAQRCWSARRTLATLTMPVPAIAERRGAGAGIQPGPAPEAMCGEGAARDSARPGPSSLSGELYCPVAAGKVSTVRAGVQTKC